MRIRRLAAALAGLLACSCGLADAPKVTRGCANARDYRGALRPYHTIPLWSGLEFSRQESFPTGAPAYSAFATWDECTLFLGFAGPALGPGRCDDPSRPGCSVPELGGSPFRFAVFYLDTDPLGHAGTRDARAFGDLDWRLPFRADYLVVVRTDGYTEPRGDSLAFVGNVRVYRWTSLWSTSVERTWAPHPEEFLRVGGAPGRGSLVVALDLAGIGSPCAVQALGWVLDTEHGEGFAHWPAAAAPDGARPPHGRAARDTTDSRGEEAETELPLDHYYGFVLGDSLPPASSLNLNRLSYPDCAE